MQPQFSVLGPSTKTSNTPASESGALVRMDQTATGTDQPKSFAAVLAANQTRKGETLSGEPAEQSDQSDQPTPELPHADVSAAKDDTLHSTEDADLAAPFAGPKEQLAVPAIPKTPGDQNRSTVDPLGQGAADIKTSSATSSEAVARDDGRTATALAGTTVGAASRGSANLWQTVVLPQESATAKPVAQPIAQALTTPLPTQPAQSTTTPTNLDSESTDPLLKGSSSLPLTAVPRDAAAGALGKAPRTEQPLPASGAATAHLQMKPAAGRAEQTPRSDTAPTHLPPSSTLLQRQEIPNQVAGMTDQPALLRDPARRHLLQSEEGPRGPRRTDAPMTASLQAPVARTKQVVPVTQWQANTALPAEHAVTKELFSIDPITGEPRLSTLTTGTTPTAAVIAARPELPTLIARQLAEGVQQQPNRTVEITLKPQELGSVRLSLQHAEAGIVVSLTAERPETLDLMRRNIDQLGAEFRELGYANITFSFAGADTDTDAESQTNSDDGSASSSATSQDATAAPTTHIHLANSTSNGVDLRL